MTSTINLNTLVNETKEKVNEFVEEFVYYLYGDEGMDWYWIGEVGSVASVGDMFFGLEDMFLYMRYTPDEIHDIYREYLDVSETMSLSAFIKEREGIVEEETQVDLDKIEKDFLDVVKETVEQELSRNGIMVTKFIKSKKTGKILYSRRPGDFQCEYDNNGDVLLFIDQSLFYTRMGGEEGVDYELVDKPIKECIKLRCDDGQYKWISDMSDKDIAYQLSKKYCYTLKNIIKTA